MTNPMKNQDVCVGVDTSSCRTRVFDIGTASHRRLNGLTIVELLLYIAILSLVSIGIMQLMLEVQRSNINLLSHADNFAKADLALRRVQVMLGDSDDVEVSDLRPFSGDQACLRLKTYDQYQRAGYRFDGRNQYIRTPSTSQGYIEIDAADPRTISVWVRVDPKHAGTGTVVTWGVGRTAQFGIDIVNGEPIISFNCARMRAQGPVKDLRDGEWHHIAVTHAPQATGEVTQTTTRLYVDGVAIPAAFEQCGAYPGNRIFTRRTSLYIGRDILDRQAGYTGLISDLRIWQRPLTVSEIKDLAGRDPAANQNVNGLYASFPLDSHAGGSIVNRGTWAGGGTAQLTNYSGADPVAQTLVDATTYHSFCFLDADNDRLFELWESESSKTVPSLPLGTIAQLNAQGWTKRSEDIFVPGRLGFFKVVGNDPESVIANFAVGKGVLDSPDRQEQTVSKALASTRVKRRLELCAVEVAPKINAPDCNVSQAFVAIDGYMANVHGRLDLQYVTWQKTGDVWVARELPNMPTSVTATWYEKLGVMKYSSPQSLETRLWKRIIGQTLYRPRGRTSDSRITFTFGVGGIPFFENSGYSMYDFVDKSAAPPNFDNASTEAVTSDGGFCGMRSYLASITSEAEQDNLETVMLTGTAGQWQSGWIGATVDQGQIFNWISGPRTGTPFWQGTGASGLPYDATTGQIANRREAKFFEFDQKPGVSGHRKRILTRREGTTNTRYRYTNWAGGTDSDSCDSVTGAPPSRRAQLCEPLFVSDGTGVAIHGHMGRDGTWFSVPTGPTACDVNQPHSICGYYREFDNVGLQSGAVLAQRLTVNMDRFREFCQTSP